MLKRSHSRGRTKKQAITFTRQVNTLQSQALSVGWGYLSLGQVTLSHPVPQGFVMQLAADAVGYSFSVVDQSDPCRFGLFSNQDGLIYRGEALR
jgi:hypothetical protein